jgi:GxxExxY protein
MHYLYTDLTEKIIRAYYRVFDFYRAHPGYAETNLRDALQIELEKLGLCVQTEAPVRRAYAGQTLGEARMDLVVEEKVALELKLTARLERDAIEQIDTYLTDAKLAVGLLLKFHRRGPEIKRRFNRTAAPRGESA